MELTINGQRVIAEPGETVLKCALRNDIHIPHLCTHPSLPPFGACRMCIVEIEGMRGYPTACTTPVADGMVVHTDTEPLRELRRNILGLMMLEHPSACLLCSRKDLCEEFRPKSEKVGRTTGCHTCNNKQVCDVRKLSEDLGFSALPVAPLYHYRPVERSEPFIDRDLNLCILCGRCVRVCKHHHDTSIIDFVGRGSISRIGEAFGRTLLEANCRFCGSCVEVCPTGSLSDRYSKWVGKADTYKETTCIFCDEGCAISVGTEDGKAVLVNAIDPNRPLCVLGRFAVAPFMNGADRLHTPLVRVENVLREMTWEHAVPLIAEKLKNVAGESFCLICDTSSPIEDRHVMKRFTHNVMKSSNYLEAIPDRAGNITIHIPSTTKVALIVGNLISLAEIKNLETVILIHCYPSPLMEKAYAVLPAAIFTETSGTVADKEGILRPLNQVTTPPGTARPEREILSNIAECMGIPNLLADKEVQTLSRQVQLNSVKKDIPKAASDPRQRRNWFRGHNLATIVGGLKVLPLNGGMALDTLPKSSFISRSTQEKVPFQVVSKKEISPNNYEIVFYAPAVAKKAKAGQFVIVMADATSERTPYTLCDWNAKQGTITLVIQEKGQSSRKLALMEPGDAASHIVGPLGTPLAIENYGTVVLLGGCYGIGAHIANAKALKAAGNQVVVIIEARSHYLHYYEKELSEIADEVIASTIDGSNGVRGHAIDVLLSKIKAGKTVDRVIVVGCPFMMMVVAKETRELSVPVWVALNPIMLDGTGMCGACRVTVAGETRFACVDGPFFDAHQIDWEEFKDRREAYSDAEISALSTTEPVVPAHHHEQGKCWV